MMTKLEVKYESDSEQDYYFDLSIWLGLTSNAQQGFNLTINHSLELIQSFKMILLKKFCMHTKVLLFQYTYHEYTIRSIDSL